MTITIKENDKYLLFTITDKKLTTENVSELKAQIIKTCRLKKSAICDMKNVVYVDSSGLSGMLIGDRLFKENDARFLFCNCSKKVLQLAEITKIDSIITIVPTLSEAKDYILMDEIEKSFKDDK